MKNPVAQASHILKSYLTTLDIPHESPSLGVVMVKAKDGSRTVRVSFEPGDATDVAVNAEDMSSFKLKKAMRALHVVTAAAGWGEPLPVDRGAGPEGRITYRDDYESVYLRHSILRRSPNMSEAQLDPYKATIKTAARKALYRWRNVFQPMGFGEGDLVSVGTMYTMAFVHNYASSEEHLENIKLLHKFLKQRFGEFAKISFKKAQNSTCLAQSIRPDKSNDDEAGYIDTYAESEEASAEDEYNEDTLMLTYSDGTERTLRVVNDGYMGLNMYLDGSILSKADARGLTESIRNGAVKKRLLTVEEVEESTNQSRNRIDARGVLHQKLNAMDPTQRETVLSYAALGRDFCPDTRREARRLCEELACPKCDKKVPSGTICLTCRVEAKPRFGIDYVAFRQKLIDEHHPMAEAMTAPIPESETRLKARKPVLASIGSLASHPVEAKTLKLAMTEEKKVEMQKLIKSMGDALMATLPDRAICPKCKRDLPKNDFGIRVAKDKATGIPIRASRQSYCNPCRKPTKG